METPKPLQNVIEMNTSINNIGMSKNYLYNLHQQKLKNAFEYTKNTKTLVEILGGIDLILENILSSKCTNFPLTDKQLNSIHQVISTETVSTFSPQPQPLRSLKYQKQATLLRLQPEIQSTALGIQSVGSKSLSIINPLENDPSQDQPNEFYYGFYVDDTFLHTMFNESLVDKISNVLHSSITQSMIIITPIIYVILMTTSFYTIYYAIFTIIIPGFLWLPYCTFWLLHGNRVAFKMINKSFEYWLKIVFGIIYALCSSTNYFLPWKHFEYVELMIIARIIVSIGTVLAVMTISSFDSAETKRKWKTIASASYAMVFTVISIKLQYLQYQQPDDSVVYIYNNVGFSLKQNQMNSAKIIAIFFWKQAIQGYRFPGRSIMLRYYPYIIYIDGRKCDMNEVTSITPKTNQIPKQSAEIPVEHSNSLSLDLSERETSQKL